MPTLGQLYKLPGLSAADRTDDDKKALHTYTGANSAEDTIRKVKNGELKIDKSKI